MAVLKKIEPEIVEKFYGCGSPIPPVVEGCVVLDLGCGTGRDVYITSRLAGPDGLVIGVDMTDEQLEIAEKHLDTQVARFGFAKPNVDFRRILRAVGCPDYRVVSKRRVSLDDPEIQAKAGMIDFYSMTIRAFKLDTLEDICEDYGQTATYLGTVRECPRRFVLDDHHVFAAGKPMLVCGNTASMLQETRYSGHFEVTGDRSTHYGPFDCACSPKKPADQDGSGAPCCY